MSLRKNIIAVIVCALLLALFTITAWSAWLGKSATFDEPLHLASAWLQTHYDDFSCDFEDPPLWKYLAVLGTRKTALKVDRQSPEWNAMFDSARGEGLFFRNLLYYTPGNDADMAIRSGRERMIFIGIFLGAAIAWWAWRLSGPVAAVAATAFFCLDPNFIAHSPLIKNDVAMALSFLLLTAAIWLLGERASFPRWAAVALLLGVALTVKFSGILAIPILAIALLCRALLPAPWRIFKWMARTHPQRFAAAIAMGAGFLLTAYVFIWAAYGFRFGPTTDPAQQLNLPDVINMCCEREQFLALGGPIAISNPDVAQWKAHWRPSLPVRLTQWADRHRILPQPWLVGFLFTYGTTRVRTAFLCGQSSLLGWWYYFPLAMAFKTPLATLLALALAAGFWFWRRPWKAKADYWPMCAALVAPILYMSVAMQSHLDLGLRHILPVYPYLFIFLGVVLANAWRAYPRIARGAACILLAGLTLETACAYPNFIPFFNVVAGGWRGGIRLLGDSNIDWGQELFALADWQRNHPDRQLFLYYFGSADPRYYGIHYFDLQGSDAPPDEQRPGRLPPIYALSATAFQDPYISSGERNFYKSLQNRAPIAVLGGSMYLFDPSGTN